MNNQVKWLKTAFLIGIITDAFALIPMIFPPVAKLIWGFDEFDGYYFFAMGYGASLMAGWTLVLIWAYKKPLERRFISFLTMIIIIGLISTEMIALANGSITMNKVIPTIILQIILLGLFGFGYAVTHQQRSGE